MRGFLTQVFPNTGRVLGLNKQQVSKQQYNFFCTKRTKNTKGGFPLAGLCLCLLGVPLVDPGPGHSPRSLLLVLLGGGEDAVSYQVAGALTPASSLLCASRVTHTSTSTSHESLARLPTVRWATSHDHSTGLTYETFPQFIPTCDRSWSPWGLPCCLRSHPVP